MGGKLAGTEALGESVSVTGWKLWFSVSIDDLVTNTVNPSLKLIADVDVVLGVDLDEDKLSVTVCNCGSLISIVFLVRTTGTASLGYGLDVSIGDLFTTCSSSSVLSTYNR